MKLIVKLQTEITL